MDFNGLMLPVMDLLPIEDNCYKIMDLLLITDSSLARTFDGLY